MFAGEKVARTSTGIAGLDKMLGGGLLPGRVYMLSGDHGSGKSTVCGHFLMEGVKKGEQVLYLTIDSPPSDISGSLSSFGWDPGKITILNAHPKVRDYRMRGSTIDVAAHRSVGALKDMDDKKKEAGQISPDLSLPSLQLMLQKEFEAKSYDRLVIDSLISLRLLGVEEIQWELGINSVFRLLMEDGVTTLIVSDDPKPGEPVRPEFFMAHGIIKTNRMLSGGKILRTIYIEKMRGSSHDDKVRQLEIKSKGAEIDLTKSPPQESLSTLALRFPKP